ncbi:uncharacterized protein LOC112569274 [Pomacea canaliculata]|uniref:uncharacterized protein LOC112569274 n=1 Tax=Pomacea canaliculata TaxID=400727 RepID=UPI000D73DFD5|nr:uncharacterized protein LOC112569274 [Pomacea canaliculata]
MACSLQYGIPWKLNFTFPEGGYKKNFKLNLIPDEGIQRSIITCKWSDSYKCDTEDGFGIEFPSDNEALITLPMDFNDTPGSLNCQFSGQQVTSPVGCSWPVRASEPILWRSEESGNEDSNPGIIIGCVIGSNLIVFMLLLFILLYRRYKHQQSPCSPEEPNMNESPLPGSKKEEISLFARLNAKMVDNKYIFLKNITRKETDVSKINEMKPSLGNEDNTFTKRKNSQEQESNEKNSCKMSSEKKSGDKEADSTNNDKGFQEKRSDEEKAVTATLMKKTSDDGFGGKRRKLRA